MRAEIIAIGDELTSGQRLDTNSQWLATQLGNLGVQVAFHTTIGDRLEDNLQAFRVAASRCDLIVSTGGLGPTADDLTRDAIAEAFCAPLEFRQEAMDHILGLFANRKRPMPERNRVQAMFPQGSRLIDNKHGTAPGIDLVVSAQTKNSCRIFALPGVPAEMHEMFEQVVQRRMIDEMGLGSQQWFYKNLRLFGIGESDVEALIPDLIARQREPIVGITVSKATINLRIATLAKDAAEADAKMISTVQEIETHLSSFIYGADHDEPWDAVIRALESRRESIQIFEFGATSVLGSALTNAASEANANERVVSTSWSAQRSDAMDIGQADWTLVLGPYPRVFDDMPFGGQFEIQIWSRDGLVHQRQQPIAGHPEIILHRLAKTGAKAWLDYLAGRT